MERDPSEDAALKLFLEQLERSRADADAAVGVEAMKIPAFAALIQAADPATQAEQSRRSVALQRNAILEGQWEEYLADLRAQGRLYAGMGIEFRDWYSLLGSYRKVIWNAALPSSSAHALGVLTGMERLLDVAMSEIGSSYIATKEDLVRQAEAQLERFSDMFRHASLGMAIWRLEDPDDLGTFRMIAANPAAAKLASLQSEANVGRLLRDINPLYEATGVQRRWAAMLQDRVPCEWTQEVGDDPNTMKTLSVRCFPLQDRDLGVVLEDITERERMTAQINRHLRELERSNRDLDDFAYVTSHDLKSPLRDVRNLVSWVVQDARAVLPVESARHLTLIDDRVSRMERLLDDLLEYSRVGRAVDTAREFEIGEVFNEVIALQPPPAGFTVTLEGDTVTVFTPRAPFAKVLRNLIGNAIKHHDQKTGSVVVSAVPEGDRVLMRVTDDGPGIPERFHDRVFRMFQTLQSRDVVEGSGVGLTIVKRSIEMFGGEVHIESEGRGTAMVFTWPRSWTQPKGDEQ